MKEEREVEEYYRANIRRYKQPLKLGCQIVFILTLCLAFSGLYLWAILLPFAWIVFFALLAIGLSRRAPVGEMNRSSFAMVEASARIHATSAPGAFIFDIMLFPYSLLLVWFGRHGRFHWLARRGRRSIPELIRIAKEECAFDKWRAVRLLGALEGEDAVEVLADCAASEDVKLREAAVLSLRQIETNESSSALAHIAETTSDDMTWFLAVAALRSRSIDAPLDHAKFIRAWNAASSREAFDESDTNEALGDFPLAYTEEIIRKLGERRWTMLHGTFRELGKLKEPGAKELFLEFLATGEEDKCLCALFGLSELGDPTTLGSIEKFEVHVDSRIRTTARIAARRIRETMRAKP